MVSKRYRSERFIDDDYYDFDDYEETPNKQKLSIRKTIDLVKNIQEQAGFTKKEALKFLETFSFSIQNTLTKSIGGLTSSVAPKIRNELVEITKLLDTGSLKEQKLAYLKIEELQKKFNIDLLKFAKSFGLSTDKFRDAIYDFKEEQRIQQEKTEQKQSDLREQGVYTKADSQGNLRLIDLKTEDLIIQQKQKLLEKLKKENEQRIKDFQSGKILQQDKEKVEKKIIEQGQRISSGEQKLDKRKAAVGFEQRYTDGGGPLGKFGNIYRQFVPTILQDFIGLVGGTFGTIVGFIGSFLPPILKDKMNKLFEKGLKVLNNVLSDLGSGLKQSIMKNIIGPLTEMGKKVFAKIGEFGKSVLGKMGIGTGVSSMAGGSGAASNLASMAGGRTTSGLTSAIAPRAGGSLLSTAGRFAPLALGGATAGGGAAAAGGAAAGGGMLAGLGALALNPITLGVLAAGGLAYGGYKAYQQIKRKKAQTDEENEADRIEDAKSSAFANSETGLEYDYSQDEKAKELKKITPYSEKYLGGDVTLDEKGVYKFSANAQSNLKEAQEQERLARAAEEEEKNNVAILNNQPTINNRTQSTTVTPPIYNNVDNTFTLLNSSIKTI